MLKCAACNVTANSVCNFRTHLATKKHILNVERLERSQLIVDTTPIINMNNRSILEDKQETISKYTCKCCKKELSSNFNLKRHIKKCEKAQQLINNNAVNIIDNLLGGKIDKLLLESKQPINIVINNITNNTNNNTNTNTNNINNNVIQFQSTDDEYYNFWKGRKVNPVGFENTDMLKNKEIADRIHGGGLNAFVELIKAVYSHAQNHNVALFNRREKLVKYINSSGEIEITTLQKMLDLLVMNNIDVLDNFLDDKDIPIRKTYKNIIDKLKFIHEQDGDNPYLPKYLEALRLILLNISKSALDKITEFENVITNDVAELEKKNSLLVPRTDFRLVPS